MSKEFEFRVRGDIQSFTKLLEKNNIQYSFLPMPRRREKGVSRTVSRTDKESTFVTIDNILARTMTVEGLVLKLVVGLTPFALQTIWKWYKGRGKGSRVSVKIEGDLLELDAKTMKALGKFFNEASKRKARRKRLKRSSVSSTPIFESERLT
jgi:hypothetical protein